MPSWAATNRRIKRAVLDAGIGGDAQAFLRGFAGACPWRCSSCKGAKPGANAARLWNVVEGEAAPSGGRRNSARLAGGVARPADRLIMRERDRGMADGVALAMNALSRLALRRRRSRPRTCATRTRSPICVRGLTGAISKTSLESLLVTVEPQGVAGSGARRGRRTTARKRRELAEKLAGPRRGGQTSAFAMTWPSCAAMQEAPDSPEALATLPRLGTSDIGAAKPEPGRRARCGVPAAVLAS